MIPFGFWKNKAQLFTWLGGPTVETISGSFGSGSTGTPGVASSSLFPSERAGIASWRDSSGNLWLFGGYGYDFLGNEAVLNDLWKFNPTTGQWTWVMGYPWGNNSGSYGTKGTASASNIPGARNFSATWVDSSGNLWLFGGNGLDSVGNWNELNDLWSYSPTSGQWTWVSGNTIGAKKGTYGTKGTAASGNVPGAREQATGWTDSSGNFWLFGGYGFDSNGNEGRLNDLWRYQTGTGMWTYMAGSKTYNGAATYGTQGTGNTSNIPGSRTNAAGWADSSGFIWLFGGWGIDKNNNTDGLNDLWKYEVSSQQWTWVGGSNVAEASGVYGTQGTAASGNIPGARDKMGFAKDTSGNFWLYGGNGWDIGGGFGALGDLWKYSPTSGQWTWMGGSTVEGAASVYGTQGTANSSNTPGARTSMPAIWADTSGYIWLFGGEGIDNIYNQTYLEDLWKFNPTSRQWTWTTGPSQNFQMGSFGTLGTASSTNLPPARYNAYTWVDTSGNLWMLGGIVISNSGHPWYGNDLWKYNPTSSQWTWMGGTSAGLQTGIYGTKGTGSTANMPGAHGDGAFWTDSSGNFWLFGGDGFDSAGSNDLLNDLWKYNPTNGQWTWVSGSNFIDQVGTYGTKGTPASGNVPGARNQPAKWIDTSGNLWLFGGWGYANSATQGHLNDLWKYNMASGQWTWVAGANTYDSTPTYGTKGVGSTSNIPGARSDALSWIDTSGNLWLFGGFGLVDNANNWGYLNDLWKFEPSTLKWTWVSGSNLINPNGTYGALNVPGAANAPGGRQMAMGWTDPIGNLWLFGGRGYDSVGFYDNMNDLWYFNVSTSQWTWMGGPSVNTYTCNFGTMGVTAATNAPPVRYGGATWIDSRGRKYFFGGNAADCSPSWGLTNDLWLIGP